ncbi:hypothetical protein V6N11_020036 [Hibiscus sabdariffa]|uniref:Transposase n=1 Tax=Hibiscus sabdariffa TaxID=183260 RepID=A0ABR2P985_9ROSI
MSTIGLGTSDGHSTPTAKEFGINLDDANEMDEDEIDLENVKVHVPQTNDTNNNSEVRNTEDESESHPFKRVKKYVVWKEFGEPERVGNSKVWKVPCVYCTTLLTVSKGGPTTHLKRHSDKCLKEWDIENKVFIVSADNASTNDSCIQIMKDTFSLTKRLICGGKLFHVRCCAHILNIMVQHGLKQVKSIIKNVHETVDYLNGSEQRLKKFAELAQQYNLKESRLVLECKTRWNSTYEMLDCAIKFKEVFSILALEDREYVYCPTLEDWGKIEKLLEILKVFYDTTNIISGSEYPTSNLFLSEIYRIILLLDTSSKSSDDFVKGMVKNTKERENIHKVRETLYELYDEYVNLYSPPLMEQMGECGTSANACGERTRSTPGLLEILQAVRSEELTENRQFEVDLYLEEGCYIPQEREEQRMKCLESWTRIMEGRNN